MRLIGRYCKKGYLICYMHRMDKSKYPGHLSAVGKINNYFQRRRLTYWGTDNFLRFVSRQLTGG